MSYPHLLANAKLPRLSFGSRVISSAVAKSVLLTVWAAGDTPVTLSAIVDRTGLGQTSVWQSIVALERAGLLVRLAGRKSGSTGVYRVVPEAFVASAYPLSGLKRGAKKHVRTRVRAQSSRRASRQAVGHGRRP